MRTIQRNIVGALIISADGKILLGNSIKGGVYQDRWIVPGGGIDEGETKLEAVKRELLEEIGLDISTAEVSDAERDSTGESIKTLRDTGEEVMVHMNFCNFIIKLPQPSHEVQLSMDDDFTNATWFDRAELPELTFSPPTQQLLDELGYI